MRLICAIIVTGAAVRLTGSGLGCADWPACSSTKFIDVSSRHAAIEQLNRLFTGLVSVAVIAAVLGSLVRMPRRRDLTLLSLGLVAGVVAQIVLGGITVLVDLHPAAVQGHMLLSLILVADAVVLVHRAVASPTMGWRSARCHRRSAVTSSGSPCSPRRPSSPAPSSPAPGRTPVTRRHGASAVAIADAARVHGTTVVLAVAAMVTLAWRLRWRPTERAELAEWMSAWILVALLQGAIGYIQYFNEVPALLVGIHVLGATVLWAITVAMVVRTFPARRAAPVRDGARAAAAALPMTP